MRLVHFARQNEPARELSTHARIIESSSRTTIVLKDSGVIPHVLTQILDRFVNGVTLIDPDIDD